MRHLKLGGVLACQATNRFVDIAPVVERLARDYGMTAVLISDWPESDKGADYWLASTDQILVTTNRALLDAPKIRDAAKVILPIANFPVWTDEYNNLFRILK